jgi:hypothetical protein
MLNRTTSIVAMALAFAVGCLTAGYVPQADMPIARAAEDTPTWAYKCITDAGGDGFVKEANAIGAEGWEMVAAQGTLWCFKRPVARQ